MALPTITRKIRLHQTQRDFLHSDSPVRGFVGGRGSGKSHAGALDLITRAKRGRLYLVAAPTYTMLSDASLRTFLAVGRDLGVIAPGDVKQSAPPSVRLTTGATVIFRSADDPDRLRGSNLSGAWLDEAGQMSREAFEVVTAALREGGERGWLSCTFTPRGLSHWTADVFHRPGPDVATFHARTADNPFLPAGFETDVRAQYGSNLRAEQELAGRFVNVSGSEWSSSYFDEALILFTEWPDPSQIVRSVLSVDPSKGKLRGDWQTLVISRLDREGRFWCDCEAIKVDEVRLLERMLELIDQWQPDVTVVESNAGGSFLMLQASRAKVRGLRPPVIGRHHGSDSNKVMRINVRLTPLWSRGLIRLRRGSPGVRQLIGEAMDFPEGTHDDCLDALELGIELHGQLVLPKDMRRVSYELPS